MLAASQLVHASSFILLIAGKICFDCEAKKNQHFVLFNRVHVVIFRGQKMTVCKHERKINTKLGVNCL